MTSNTQYDVIIVGGGLAGLTLSCLLGRAGIKTACIDQLPTNLKNSDLRTTAISYGSRDILRKAGIWQRLDGKTCAIEEIKILDEDSPLLLDFLSAEADGKQFGWIVLNSDLRAAMMDELKTHESVTHIAPAKVKDFSIGEKFANVILENENTLSAKLIVGADGRNSFTREWMDVPVREWSYNQRAIICTAIHEHPHHNVAVEHFWPAGPFAILPMADDEHGNHRSSVVFTEHGPKSNSLMNLSDSEFENALQEKFPSNYGHIKMVGHRAAHELGLVHAMRYTAPRMVLVADAAHGIHPVAGQGLNLGFRDIEALAALLADAADPGDPNLLESWQRQRRFDNMTMAAVTDGLVRLFGSRLPPVRALRRTGLKIVAKLPVAKRFFMKQAMGDRALKINDKEV